MGWFPVRLAPCRSYTSTILYTVPTFASEKSKSFIILIQCKSLKKTALAKQKIPELFLQIQFQKNGSFCRENRCFEQSEHIPQDMARAEFCELRTKLKQRAFGKQSALRILFKWSGKLVQLWEAADCSGYLVFLWKATEFIKVLIELVKSAYNEEVPCSLLLTFFSVWSFPKPLLNTSFHNIGQNCSQSNAIRIPKCLFLIILWPIKS